jgi:hypothetical protein
MRCVNSYIPDDQEWEKIWEAGIEVGARFELGQAVNSSLYYLLRSAASNNYVYYSTYFFLHM